MATIEASDRRGLFAAWSRIRLDSGERVLVSMSANGIVIMKLVLRGLLPISRIWSGSIIELVDRYGYGGEPGDDHIDKVVAVVISCASISDIRIALQNEFSN